MIGVDRRGKWLTSCPVHHVGSALIRTKEQQLWLAVEVNQGFFDAWGLARDEQVDDSLDCTS
jgi:hypothetical protein